MYDSRAESDAIFIQSFQSMASRKPSSRRIDGPNWALLAGGALATAMSVLIGRIRRNPAYAQSESSAIQESESTTLTSSLQASVSSTCSDVCTDSFCSGLESRSYRSSDGQFGCGKGIAVLSMSFDEHEEASGISSLSPHINCRKTINVNVGSLQQKNTPGCLDCSENHNKVHKLRKQLKGRDQMIMEMQEQLLEQGRTIHLYQFRMAELERQLKEANRSIYQADQIVQCLHNAFGTGSHSVAADSNRVLETKSAIENDHTADASNVSSGVDEDSDVMSKFEDSDGVAVHKEEKDRLSMEVDQDNDTQKLSFLEFQLAKARSLAEEKAYLLRASEIERLKLIEAIRELEKKLEMQAIELEQIEVCENVDHESIQCQHEDTMSTSQESESPRYKTLDDTVDETMLHRTDQLADNHTSESPFAFLTACDYRSKVDMPENFLMASEGHDYNLCKRCGALMAYTRPSTWTLAEVFHSEAWNYSDSKFWIGSLNKEDYFSNIPVTRQDTREVLNITDFLSQIQCLGKILRTYGQGLGLQSPGPDLNSSHHNSKDVTWNNAIVALSDDPKAANPSPRLFRSRSFPAISTTEGIQKYVHNGGYQDPIYPSVGTKSNDVAIDSISIDASLDGMLDDTLDDLIRACRDPSQNLGSDDADYLSKTRS